MDNRFDGKRVVITGGSAGFSRSVAEQIANEGATVIVTGWDEDKLAEVRKSLPANILVLCNYAANIDGASQLRRDVETGGRIDALWLHAGYADFATIGTADATVFDRMMTANIGIPVLQMAALGELLNDNASVVITSSTTAYVEPGVTSVYTAIKAAFLSLIRCWASGLGERGIRVNALFPGQIFSDAVAAMESELNERMGNCAKPTFTPGSKNEAVAIAFFLLSDESSPITAKQYLVDGSQQGSIRKRNR